MKPVQLASSALALALLGSATAAFAQPTPATDAEPAATVPAPPPAPLPPADPSGGPPGAELPPPPPPRGSPPPPPQGKLVISAPPLPPAMPRAGYKTHDGFYLRLGLGIGGGNVSVSTDSRAANDFSVGGAGLALNVWAGGTPWRGVALGALLNVQGMAASDVKVGGTNTHQDLGGTVVLLGPFIDAFPDPLRGLHVGGSLALAGVSAKAKNDILRDSYLVKDYGAGGFGGSAWVGYMGWVGPEWSMGGLLQLSAVRVREDKNDIERLGSGYTLSLSFSALYH